MTDKRRSGRLLAKRGALLLGAAIAGLPAGAHAENLLDIVESAQANDPEFQAAGFQNRADAENTRQAWSRFLPHARAGASYDYTHQDIVSSDNSVYAIGANSYPDYGYDVTVDQSIFNFSNWANLRAAKALRRQSNAQYEVAKQDLLLRVVERYFTVLVAQETAQASRYETRALKEHLDLTQSKHARGGARDAELLDAQAHYQLSLAKQVQVDAAVADALSALKELTGKLPMSLNTMSDDMQAHPLSPADNKTWIDMAVANNPRIVAADQAAERGENLVEVEKSAYMPTVGLQLFHDRRKTEGSLFGGGSDIQQYGARVKLEVPLYDGGMTASRVREARNLYGKAVADSTRTRRNVERETTEALNGLETAISRVEALKASTVAQEKVVATLSEAYKAGVSPSVDYLDAERDLFLARAEYSRARYDYALDTIRLRHAVGMLGIEDLAEVNRQLVAKPVVAGGSGNGPAS